MTLLRNKKLSPSNATWDVMSKCEYLPPVEEILRLKTMEYTEGNCLLKNLKINQDICRNSDPTNEGQPTLLCGNFVTHIVGDINTFLKDSYKFEIFPIVKKEVDQRENKESDYTIFRIMNKLTYIVIEVKLSVGRRLTVADKDKLAQLFLEATYVYEEEGHRSENNKMLCILTDATTWHLIVADVGRKPIKFISHFSTSVDNWDNNLDVICNKCVHHIQQHTI